MSGPDPTSSSRALLLQAADLAATHLEQVVLAPARPVAPPATPGATSSSPDSGSETGPETLPERGCPADRVLEELASAGRQGAHACSGGRYFGFVTGGTLPAALVCVFVI